MVGDPLRSSKDICASFQSVFLSESQIRERIRIKQYVVGNSGKKVRNGDRKRN